MKKNDLEIQNKIQLFDDKKIRSVWDSEQEKWYFAIVDVISSYTSEYTMINTWYNQTKTL